ncbi:tetraacyldisaccharide 4'-kinase [Desulfobotulus sp.]|uniref:tetraacyldisaccharide 4'-kinase n=1 Tax=Desulfobotulus sp. TaxID=1940337 RepID=UPI002A3723F0|nr:tetraacyldisaccharide 4'-kinase [Desulfobotulus sp.]MDY0162404.1 tetraacyldisaccharide 4'-kinase [Desulfobotulus sp.]
MLKRRFAARLRRSGVDRDAKDRFLSFLESLYARGVDYRNRRLDGEGACMRLPLPVISVGNLVVGGTGKTPMVRFLARFLEEKGLRAAILSRGYGGRLEKEGGRVSDGEEIFLCAAEAGDEPVLLAKTCRAAVYVGANRYASGLRAMEEGAEVLILDDGFQHRKLYRDLDLVLLDARAPLGNGRLLPRGSLRERPQALRRAHALVLTHCGEKGGMDPRVLTEFREGSGLPVFPTSHRQVAWPGKGALAEEVTGERVLAFAGIADGRGFAQSLEASGWIVLHTEIFDDHHAYTSRDIRQLVAKARTLGAQALVTTAKDAVKLPNPECWPLPLRVRDVELVFGDREAFHSWLESRLSPFFS